MGHSVGGKFRETKVMGWKTTNNLFSPEIIEFLGNLVNSGDSFASSVQHPSH